MAVQEIKREAITLDVAEVPALSTPDKRRQKASKYRLGRFDEVAVRRGVYISYITEKRLKSSAKAKSDINFQGISITLSAIWKKLSLGGGKLHHNIFFWLRRRTLVPIMYGAIQLWRLTRNVCRWMSHTFYLRMSDWSLKRHFNELFYCLHPVVLSYMVFLIYQLRQQFYCISIRLLCGSTAICFGPVGSSSGNHYTNMSLVIRLFIDMDPDLLFTNFRSVCFLIITVTF